MLRKKNTDVTRQDKYSFYKDRLRTILSLVFNLFALIIYCIYDGIMIAIKGFDWTAKLLTTFLIIYAFVFIISALIFSHNRNFASNFKKTKLALIFLKKLGTLLYLFISVTVAFKSISSGSRNMFVFTMAVISVVFYIIQFSIWIYIKILRKLIKKARKNKTPQQQVKLNRYQRLIKNARNWAPIIYDNLLENKNSSKDDKEEEKETTLN